MFKCMNHMFFKFRSVNLMNKNRGWNGFFLWWRVEPTISWTTPFKNKQHTCRDLLSHCEEFFSYWMTWIKTTQKQLNVTSSRGWCVVFNGYEHKQVNNKKHVQAVMKYLTAQCCHQGGSPTLTKVNYRLMITLLHLCLDTSGCGYVSDWHM